MNLFFGKIVDRWVGIPLVHCARIFEFFLSLAQKSERPEPRSILLIKLWGAGNVVLLIPIVQRIRERWPEAKITFLTLESNRELLAGLEEIDRVVGIDIARTHRFFASLIGALVALRRARPSLSVDFEQFCRLSSLMAWASGATQRVGLKTAGQSRHHLMTAVVAYRDDQHTSETFFDLARAIGVEGHYRAAAPPIPAESQMKIEALLSEAGLMGEGPLIVVHPGSGHNFIGRRWPISHFQGLLHALVERHDARVVLTGVPDEAPLHHELLLALGDHGVSLAGRISLLDVFAMVEASDLVISNDTLLVHVASATSSLVYAFYGPNTPKLYGPLSENARVFYRALPCSPCLTNLNAKESDCRLPICMESISVAEVVDSFAVDCREGRIPMAPARVREVSS